MQDPTAPAFDAAVNAATTPTQRVVVMQTAPNLGKHAQSMQCPFCEKRIVTKTENVATNKTHIIALVLCLLGCICCAPCVYCSDSCLGADHYCPECNAMIGRYSA